MKLTTHEIRATSCVGVPTHVIAIVADLCDEVDRLSTAPNVPAGSGRHRKES